MLFVTDRALTVLSEMRASSDATPEESILLYLEPDGSLGLGLAEIEEGDNVIEQDGTVVVIVTDDLAQALDGLTLDIVDEGDEIEFIITDESGEDEDDEIEADGVIVPNGAD